MAKDVIDAFGEVPEVWTFLPEAFVPQTYQIDQSEIPTYNEFTNVSAIPKNYIGKQMNVVIGLLNKSQAALDYVNTVYGALNVIETAYQAFLNNDPDNYKEFSATAGNFSYQIILSEDTYLLSASFSPVEVTVFSSRADNTYGARIKLSDGNILKYTVTQSGLKIALHVLGAASTQIEFIRDEEDPQHVSGYIYEFLTVAGKELIATGTLLYVDRDYTTVVGTKGDFIPTADSRNCEVYDTATGRMLGTEVREALGDDEKTYHTLWYHLADISGITNIRKEDTYNGVNPDTIYINGKSDTIHSMFVNGILDTSRRFDIEFKKVTSYVLNSNGDYTEVEYEVPMMFIQENCFDTFPEDYKKKNNVTVNVTVEKEIRDAVYNGYYVLVELYDQIKDAITQQDIVDYCAESFAIQ